MLLERRSHQRYALTLTAEKTDENGLVTQIQILELSVGGCFLQWFSGAELGDNFRLKIPLESGNVLPVYCKVIYRFPNNGIGIKFVGLTRFEQDLIAELIFSHVRQEKLLNEKSLKVSAFS
jgi:hypothetical protein